MKTHWTLGVLIGLPVDILGALLLLVGLGLGIRSVFFTDGYDGDHFGGWLVTGISGVCLLALVIISLFGYWPYNSEYHQWRHHGGTITTIADRFVGSGDTSTSQKFVVTFDGNPQQYACNDTRCALLHTGDHLDLSCLRTYVYSSTSGYDCNFVASRVKP